MAEEFQVGRVEWEDCSLRRFFVDWRRERDWNYEPELEPFKVYAPFVWVSLQARLAVAVEFSGYVVEEINNYHYVGGGSYYGGRSYVRDRINSVIVWYVPGKVQPYACHRHSLADYNRGWGVSIPGLVKQEEGWIHPEELTLEEFRTFIEGIMCNDDERRYGNYKYS